MPTGVYVRTEKYRRHMSEVMTGIKHSEESKRKMSKAMKGRPSHRKGKHLTEEHKRNLSKAKKGKYMGPDSSNWRGGISKIPKSRRRDLRLIEIFRAQSPEGIIRCHFCGEEVVKLDGKTGDAIHIHSIDGNHENWDPANKVPTHCACHISYHNLGEKSHSWKGDAASDSAKRKRTKNNILRVPSVL